MTEIKKEPNFFVIGAAKCGTTTLYDFLDQHPEVYMSPIKEPHHFSKDIVMENFTDEYKLYLNSRNFKLEEFLNSDFTTKMWDWYIADFNQYIKLFKKVSNEKAVGEISNGYLFSSVAAKEIKAKYPNAKIVMLLRNPMDRAYSHYLANLRDGRTTLSFKEELIADNKKQRKGWCISHCYTEMGMYSEQIKRFTDTFDKEQIKIFLNDDFKKDPEAIAKDLFTFLGVNTSVNIDYHKKQNEARLPKSAALIKFITQSGLKRRVFRLMPKSVQDVILPLFFKEGKIPKMLEEDRKWLSALFREDILKTQTIIGRNLSSWLNLSS